jgi:signal peptidase I
VGYRPRHVRSRVGRAEPLSRTVRARGLTALVAVRRAVLAAATGLIVCSVVPAAVGWTTTVVVSGSMAPAVDIGDVVSASPVSAADARRLPPGTVVLVEDPANPGTLLLHRLVGYTADNRLITKGDANAVADSAAVPAENVRGRARLRIPGLGLPVVWWRHGMYAPVAALGILGAIALFWRPRGAGEQDSQGLPAL